MRYLIVLFILTGCFPHWESPSSKLASQADNYLTNEKIYFFDSYCGSIGSFIACLDLLGFDDLCANIGSGFKKPENVRFFSPETFEEINDLSLEARDSQVTVRNYISTLEQTLEIVSNRDYSKCGEIAERERDYAYREAQRNGL